MSRVALRLAAHDIRRSLSSRNYLSAAVVAISKQHRRGGRNRAQPIAGLRNGRPCEHNVADLLHFLLKSLAACRQDDVFARISKARCAKRECDRETCASNRPTAHVTEPRDSCHSESLLLFLLYSNDKTQAGCPWSEGQSPQRKWSKRRRSKRAFASSLRLPPAAASFS
jgi:hypothetical protein